MTTTKKLTPVEAAKALNVQPCTLATWRTYKKGPPYTKDRGRVVYDERELKDWRSKHLRTRVAP